MMNMLETPVSIKDGVKGKAGSIQGRSIHGDGPACGKQVVQNGGKINRRYPNDPVEDRGYNVQDKPNEPPKEAEPTVGALGGHGGG
jgi:hypothetical protein